MSNPIPDEDLLKAYSDTLWEQLNFQERRGAYDRLLRHHAEAKRWDDVQFSILTATSFKERRLFFNRLDQWWDCQRAGSGMTPLEESVEKAFDEAESGWEEEGPLFGPEHLDDMRTKGKITLPWPIMEWIIERVAYKRYHLS